MKELLNYQDLLKIFTEDTWAKGNITRTAKRFCSDNNIEYTDSVRRRTSEIFQREMDKDDTPKTSVNHKAKILISDIETSFIKFYGFSPYNKYVPKDNLIEDWLLLTTSSKWLFEDETFDFKLTRDELLSRNDRRIVEEMWKLLDDADIVVFYNGKKFDQKKLNAKFLEFRLGLPSPYVLVDPYLTVKDKFSLTYSGLDAVCNLLGIEGKIENEKGLWHRTMQGDEEALERMLIYNINDILILEKVYLELRPYMSNHPNLGLYISDDVASCPTCGSENLDWNLKSDYITSVNRYTAFKCKCCGALGRSRSPLKLDRKNLTVNVAR